MAVIKTMQMSNFLNPVQIKELHKKRWSVTPDGAYVTIYREDFASDVDGWQQICHQLKVDPVASEVTILYFGTRQ
jgi:hypothetical protein